MDLNKIEQRLVLLECLRENATNMRIEQQAIRDRISIAIDKARRNLSHIRRLNDELIQMKLTVENAMLKKMDDQDRILHAIEKRLSVVWRGADQQQVENRAKTGIEVETMTDDDITMFSYHFK